MWNYIWPLLLVVGANTFYNICAKGTPDKVQPFAALTVTYLTAAVLSLAASDVYKRQGPHSPLASPSSAWNSAISSSTGQDGTSASDPWWPTPPWPVCCWW